MPAFRGEDVIMGQFREISTANVRENANHEWIRLRKAYGATGYECTRRVGIGVRPRQETFAGAACLPTDRAASR
jgi:hypothetical protein